MGKWIRNKQSGFTLIEIAIVLIIIGLLLGGVLKGQTMVKNAKIKRLAADAQGLAGATHAYVDSYWALPGDDAAATRWGTDVRIGNGGGTIGTGTANSDRHTFAPTDWRAETFYAMNHLRCAELVKGNCVTTAITNNATNTIALQKNAVGGVIGVDDSSGAEVNMLPTTATTGGLTGKMVCQSNVAQSYASIYDTQFDDGVGTTGSILGSAANATVYTNATLSAAYTGDETVFICTGF